MLVCLIQESKRGFPLGRKKENRSFGKHELRLSLEQRRDRIVPLVSLNPGVHCDTPTKESRPDAIHPDV